MKVISEVNKNYSTRKSTQGEGSEYESHIFESIELEVESVDKDNILDFKDDEDNSVDTILEEDAAKPVSICNLFKFADCFDIILIIIGSLSAMAVGASLPLFTIILGDLFDGFGTPPDENDDKFFQNQAAETSILFGYLAGGVFFFGFLQVSSFTISAERQTLKIREAYLQAVLNQDITWFDKRQSGELTAKIAENTVIIREAFSDKLGQLFQHSSTFISAFAVGLYFNYELALVLSATLPVLGVAGYFGLQALTNITEGSLGSYSKAGSMVEETLINIRTVTAFNAQKRILNRYNEHLVHAEKAGIKKGFKAGIGLGALIGVMFLTYSLGFFYGAKLIEDDRIAAFEEFSDITQFCSDLAVQLDLSESDFCANSNVFLLGTNETCPCGCSAEGAECLSGGDVVLIFFSIVFGGFALAQAAPSFSALQNGRISAGKIFSVIGREPEIKATITKDDEDEFPKLTGKIIFDNITFAYPSRKEIVIFEDLNLTIEEGKSTALVGGSGCGKSTIMQLLQRFYDPDLGAIYVEDIEHNNHDLKELNLAHFRNQIGLVSQEPVLFATSIYNNIAYGAKIGQQVTEEQVFDAARAANAFDFIDEFPEKFDTLVGEKGAQLSGGQKQRIAIARAILRDPTFLLLDEATSALDNESERVVQVALDRLVEEGTRTTLVIAHRLSTIRNCDKIFVLGDKTVLEEGTHDTLVNKNNGVYSMLVNAANKTQEKDDEDQNVTLIAKKLSPKNSTKDNSVVAVEVYQEEVVEEVNDQEEVSKVNKKKKEKRYSVPITRVFTFSKNEICWYLPAVLGAAMVGVQFPLFAVFLSDLITALFEPDSADLRRESNKFSIIFIFLAAGTFIGNFLQYYCFGYIGEKMTKRVRIALFGSLLKQEIGFFDDEENSVGALSANLATDAALVKAVISDRLGLLVMNLTTVVSGLTIAFLNSWRLTLVMIGLLPLIILGGALELIAFTSAASKETKDLGEAAQVLQESISGIRTVTAFNAKNRVVELYNEKLKGPRKQARKKGFIVGVGFGFSQAVQFSLYAVAFYVGGIFIDKGFFDFNQLLTVFFAVVMTGTGLGQAAALAPDAAKGSVAVSSVFKLVDRKSNIDPENEEGIKDIEGDQLGFSLQDVKFRYPARPDVEIFEQLTIDLPAGSTIGLVGTSGSGKSTIISLLQRFYDPEEGTININGESSLTDVNLKWWRDQLGIVEQEPRLFATTIKENIKLGVSADIEVTDEMVIDAAKSANAHNFIMSFPEGYETLVGDQGAQLSGGQKQRICIARAIIRQPRVLLLDEATSALDNESERIVQDALDNLVDNGNMTTIVIAHRLTTIQNADLIIVLAHGEVLETGTHIQLLNRQGQYHKLWNSQETAH